METAVRSSFFSKDKAFYKALFSMLALVALQNIVAYSVNMADNIMLGSYSQNALSGAATVNQIFFMVQQFGLSFGNALVAIAAQYWGEKNPEPIRRLTGITLKLGIIVSLVIVLLCACFPQQLLQIFTNDQAVIAEGCIYLKLIQWTFLMFIVTNILMSMLRAVGTVKISFYISVVSLIVNVGINYVLIFGKFGAPKMGIRGASVGTFVARAVELIIVIVYVIRVDDKIRLFDKGLKEIFRYDRALKKDFTKIYIPIFCAQVLWGISVPMQTAILGHLSSNALAANSVATTFYQYLKVIVLAMSAVSGALIGNAIGRGDREEVKRVARSLSVIDLIIGIILGVVIILVRQPVVGLYSDINPDTAVLANQMLLILGFVMMGMAYQMPVSFGIIQGAGNPQFTMKMNMISTWCIVMPLSMMAAFWWKLPVPLVVIFIQSDQFFKCLPVFVYFRKYKWIKKLTH